MKINYQIKKDQNYTFKDEAVRTTNINILLNRVKTNQKNENRKKIYFSALASSGLILFGILIF